VHQPIIFVVDLINETIGSRQHPVSVEVSVELDQDRGRQPPDHHAGVMRAALDRLG
jgi:hypothetical protein